MDMKLELIKMLDKVPEKMLPDSLKKRMDLEAIPCQYSVFLHGKEHK